MLFFFLTGANPVVWLCNGMMLAAKFFKKLGGYFCMLSNCTIRLTPLEENEYQELMLTNYYDNVS